MNVQGNTISVRPAASAHRFLWSFIRQHWLVMATLLLTVVSSCWLMSVFGETDILVLHLTFMGIITSCFLRQVAATKSESSHKLKPRERGESRGERREDGVAVAVMG